MIKKLITFLACLVLTLAPAEATNSPFFVHWGTNIARTPILTQGNCATSTSNATTYNPAGFQALATNIGDSVAAYVIVGVAGEDSADTFSISSLSIDGVAASSVTQAVPTSSVNVISGIFRAADVTRDNATVNISVTFSEAITSALICVWTVQNLVSSTPDAVVSGIDPVTGEPIALTLNPTVSPGVAVAISTASATSSPQWTWSVLSEQTEGAHAEASYSTAAGTTTGASMAVVSENTTGFAASSAAAWH